MKTKKTYWKYLTLVAVSLFILNPEMLQLALFIDALGLDFFLMLLEIQIITFISLFYNSKIKPIILLLINLCSPFIVGFSWKSIRADPKELLLATPSPAALMNSIVFFAAVGIALKLY